MRERVLRIPNINHTLTIGTKEIMFKSDGSEEESVIGFIISNLTVPNLTLEFSHWFSKNIAKELLKLQSFISNIKCKYPYGNKDGIELVRNEIPVKLTTFTLDDVKLQDDYILLDLIKNQTKSKEGLIKTSGHVVPISYCRVIMNSDCEYLNIGDIVQIDLIRTQWITIEDKRYLLTHPNYVIAKTNIKEEELWK